MPVNDTMSEPLLDEVDRRIVRAAQAGLPLTPRPYHAIAEQLGLTAEIVMARMKAMLENRHDPPRRCGAQPLCPGLHRPTA
jgi:hypothetical protein